MNMYVYNKCVCVWFIIFAEAFMYAVCITYRITCTVPGTIDIGKCVQYHRTDRTGNQ